MHSSPVEVAPFDRRPAPRRALRLALNLGIFGLLASSQQALAQAVDLGTAADFGVLAASAIDNTGPSVIDGDLGISPNTASSVTGFPPGVVNGIAHFADAVALQAQNDTTAAYNELEGLACNTVIAADLGGMTLTPGVYCAATSMGLTGTLTLDAQGDPDAQFVFQVGSTLTTASASAVNVINGGADCNVFWQIGSSATLGTTTAFVGNILALASITLTTGANTTGNLLARTGAVTLDSNTVTACAAGAGAMVPALSKAFNPTSIAPDGTSVLTVTLENPNAAVATLTSDLVDTLPLGVLVAPVPNVQTTCGGAGAPIAVAGSNSVTLPAGRTIPANGLCALSVNVTAAQVGEYVNIIPAGGLVTSNGNNPAPAEATLIVVALPLLSKAFDPISIAEGGISRLTVTLQNPNASVATLTGDLVDTLPIGVLVAPAPNVQTTCGGVGAPVAVAGSNSVTLPAGRSIPADGQCTLSFNVTAAAVGVYLNIIPAGGLVTSNGNNPAPAEATLTVFASIPARIVPGSSLGSLLGLGLLLGAIALVTLQRRNA